MKKLLLFSVLFLGVAGIASAQTEKKAKTPKTTGQAPAKAAAPAVATQARPTPAKVVPEAASSLFEATKKDVKKPN